MSNILCQLPRRISLPQCQRITQDLQQVRHATLIKRPKRPYTFTQLVTLTDGSTYLHRTTSPSPVYKATKDVRNNPLWNPSSQKLMNIEEDDAGRLKAFRSKFGRGWDGEVDTGEGEPDIALEADGKGQGGDALAREENLMDLISGYGNEAEKGKPKNAKDMVVTTGKKKDPKKK